MAYYPLSYILIVLLGVFVKVTHFYNLLLEFFLKRGRGVGLSIEKGAKESR